MSCCPTPEVVISNTTDPDGVGERFCAQCGHVIELLIPPRENEAPRGESGGFHEEGIV